MQTEAEVLTDHNELICSTSIERIVTGRDAALKQIETLIRQLDDISRLTSGIGGDVANHWAMRQGHAFDCWLVQQWMNLVEKMNDIVLKHFPEMLPAK
ncbi:restriction methylase [Escherichia coli]|nr:restriction methylase [Escherichia coli]